MAALTLALVEDEDTDRRLTLRTLKKNGIDGVTVYPTAEAAYAALVSTSVPRPSLLLLDVNLPGASGIELIGQLRAAGCSELPIVLLVSTSWDEERFGQRRLLADGFLKKPLVFAELQAFFERFGLST